MSNVPTKNELRDAVGEGPHSGAIVRVTEQCFSSVAIDALSISLEQLNAIQARWPDYAIVVHGGDDGETTTISMELRTANARRLT